MTTRSSRRGRGTSPTDLPIPDNAISPFDTETDEAALEQFEVIGNAALPVLEDLTDRLDSIDGAMVCTADGYNLCALGLDESQVGRLAAMASTLYSVSGGAMEAVVRSRSGELEPLEQVTLRSGETQCLVFPIKHEHLGYLLMVLWAQRVSLGELLMEAKISAREIARVASLDE